MRWQCLCVSEDSWNGQKFCRAGMGMRLADSGLDYLQSADKCGDQH